MTLTGLLLVPVALWMTDFSQPIEYGWRGPGLAAITQILNAVGPSPWCTPSAMAAPSWWHRSPMPAHRS